MPARGIGCASALTLLAALGLTGCSLTPYATDEGSGEATTVSAVPESPAGPRAIGNTPADEGIARRIAIYFRRNVQAAPWYGEIREIFVERRVVTVSTTLDIRGDAEVTRQICALIQGSDEVDSTRGHTVRGAGGASVECPPRAA